MVYRLNWRWIGGTTLNVERKADGGNGRGRRRYHDSHDDVVLFYFFCLSPSAANDGLSGGRGRTAGSEARDHDSHVVRFRFLDLVHWLRMTG
jgi:hypothetical protein